MKKFKNFNSTIKQNKEIKKGKKRMKKGKNYYKTEPLKYFINTLKVLKHTSRTNIFIF